MMAADVPYLKGVKKEGLTSYLSLSQPVFPSLE
jgi:hypothetical protein